MGPNRIMFVDGSDLELAFAMHSIYEVLLFGCIVEPSPSFGARRRWIAGGGNGRFLELAFSIKEFCGYLDVINPGPCFHSRPVPVNVAV